MLNNRKSIKQLRKEKLIEIEKYNNFEYIEFDYETIVLSANSEVVCELLLNAIKNQALPIVF